MKLSRPSDLLISIEVIFFKDDVWSYKKVITARRIWAIKGFRCRIYYNRNNWLIALLVLSSYGSMTIRCTVLTKKE